MEYQNVREKKVTASSPLQEGGAYKWGLTAKHPTSRAKVTRLDAPHRSKAERNLYITVKLSSKESNLSPKDISLIIKVLS